VALHLLHRTPTLDIYYDSWNDWLFADWQGELTLAAVQAACLKLADYLLRRPYARVLNSNTQVLTVEWEVASWLARVFLPSLSLAGVTRLAWVCSPSLRGRHMVHTILRELPLLRLSIFDELDEAVDWLQHDRTEYASGCGLPRRLATHQVQLELATQALARSLRLASPALRVA